MAKSPILWEKQPTFSDRIRNWGNLGDRHKRKQKL
jgi:hypothetical protein